MRAKLEWMKMSSLVVAALLLYGINSNSSVVAQNKKSTAKPTKQIEQNTGQRGDVYSSDYSADTRPPSSSPVANKSSHRDRLPVRKRRVLPKGKVYIKLGVTIGRGRPATESEIQNSTLAKVRVCLERRDEECVRPQDMVVERISDKTTVVQGTPIQMIVEYLAFKDESHSKREAKRVGFLYVINRVQFANGKTSPPRLIFPTNRTFGGNNVTVPGKPVMLPDPRQLWQVSRNKKAAQTYETYIIIVSPNPLKDAKGKELQGDNLSNEPMTLDETLVKKWVKDWGGGEIPSDLNGGLGQLFTQREQTASGDPTMTSRDTVTMDSDLKQGDPEPQLGFRKALPPNGTMLITIKLPFRESVGASTTKP